MKICIIENCNEKYLARGLCGKHYARWEVWRDPYFTSHKEYCVIDNCERKHYAKGLCKKHYGINYDKNHPEFRFNVNKRHLEKYSKTFDMNPNEFKWALESWSKMIKKLDNYMCKSCDSTKNLNAHHIMPKNDFPELSLELDNGITLCETCHEEAHGFKLYKSNIYKPTNSIIIE